MNTVFIIFTFAVVLLLELLCGELALALPMLTLTAVYVLVTRGWPAALTALTLTTLAEQLVLGRPDLLLLPAQLAALGAAGATLRFCRREEVFTAVIPGGAAGAVWTLLALAWARWHGGMLPSAVELLAMTGFGTIFGALFLPLEALVLDAAAAFIGVPGFREEPKSLLERRSRRHRRRSARGGRS